MSLSAIPKAIRRRIFQRDAARCQYCHLAQVGQAAVFHINHIIPKSKGGATEEGNLVLQCPYCSLHKSDKLVAADPQSGESAPLFHPLRQHWDEHFVLLVSGMVQGNTPVGRATIGALRMNDSLPAIARSVQITMGWLELPLR